MADDRFGEPTDRHKTLSLILGVALLAAMLAIILSGAEITGGLDLILEIV